MQVCGCIDIHLFPLPSMVKFSRARFLSCFSVVFISVLLYSHFFVSESISFRIMCACAVIYTAHFSRGCSLAFPAKHSLYAGGFCACAQIDAVATIRSIGRALGQRLNSTDPYDLTKHLFGRLAIALWRGNTGLWLHRHPSPPSTIDGQV